MSIAIQKSCNLLKNFYTLGIIGLGKIGMTYDLDSEPSSTHLSHLTATLKNLQFNLLGCIDPSIEARMMAQSNYGVPTFSNLEDFLLVHKPDVLILAANTVNLVPLCEEILAKYYPKLILIEKPVSYSLLEAQNLLELSRRVPTDILVNFTRRADPGFRSIKDEIKDSRFLGSFTGSGCYSGGFINNGSHMLDLLQFYFGEVRDFQLIEKSALSPQDYSVDVRLKFDECSFMLYSLKDVKFQTFEFQIFGSEKSLQLLPGSGGLQWRIMSGDQQSSRLSFLSGNSKKLETEMMHSQLNVSKELIRFLISGETSLSTLEQGVQTLQIIHMILHS